MKKIFILYLIWNTFLFYANNISTHESLTSHSEDLRSSFTLGLNRYCDGPGYGCGGGGGGAIFDTTRLASGSVKTLGNLILIGSRHELDFIDKKSGSLVNKHLLDDWILSRFTPLQDSGVVLVSKIRESQEGSPQMRSYFISPEGEVLFDIINPALKNPKDVFIHSIFEYQPNHFVLVDLFFPNPELKQVGYSTRDVRFNWDTNNRTARVQQLGIITEDVVTPLSPIHDPTDFDDVWFLNHNGHLLMLNQGNAMIRELVPSDSKTWDVIERSPVAIDFLKPNGHFLSSHYEPKITAFEKFGDGFALAFEHSSYEVGRLLKIVYIDSQFESVVAIESLKDAVFADINESQITHLKGRSIDEFTIEQIPRPFNIDETFVEYPTNFLAEIRHNSPTRSTRTR